MMGMLAQIAKDIGEATGLVALGGGILWAGRKLLTFRRAHLEIDLGGNGNGKGEQAVCAAHQTLVSLVENVAAQTRQIGERQGQIHDDIVRVHTRLDEIWQQQSKKKPAAPPAG